jgi:hypothetical protein
MGLGFGSYLQHTYVDLKVNMLTFAEQDAAYERSFSPTNAEAEEL